MKLAVVLVVWVFIIAGVYSLIRSAVGLFTEDRVAITVLVDFTQADSLVIEGDALLDGKPIAAGKVKLTVERQNPLTRVTHHVDVASGKYKAEGLFKGFQSKEQLVVTARITVFDEDGVAVSAVERANWKSSAWMTSNWLILLGIGVVIVIVWFLSVFVGQVTRRKNIAAITLSYIFVVGFLVVPFIAPMVLSRYPDLMEAMARSPVGILRAGMVGGTDPLNEWVFHIGSIPTESDTSTEAAPVYDLSKGLVIPIYVLILAVLGGAINMTRRLPGLQNRLGTLVDAFEGDKKRLLEINFLTRFGTDAVDVISKGWGTGDGWNDDDDQSGAEEGWPEDDDDLEDQRKNLEAIQDSLLKHQDTLKATRSELIDQYMFLITAPFIAIVMFYLMMMVQQELATSVPLVVLISFSSGLMSEAVLETVRVQADKIIARVKGTDVADRGEELDSDGKDVVETATTLAAPGGKKKVKKTKAARRRGKKA